MNGTTAPREGGPPPNPFLPLQRRLQVLLDKSTPHILYRWLALAAVVCMYGVRVFFLQGFYIVTYALGIYILNLLLGFLSPQVNPELEGPTLPSKSDEEFRPFVRRLPEFKFWWSSLKAVLLGFTATFMPMFDVPVFWPILVLYWFILFFVTMKRQIMHMIKYRYVPFSFGKKSYGGKDGKAAKNSK
ncbi:hypothetical protein D9Q98_004534 [Chlorella vulgaris]|uniref:Protein RER1 n=1 Tax=Chlorella vulgaris TaxID=3077 RepID=A0A9D4TQ27_CHLVU|nr:hypothetical protein D9Q98_004534 [Chlorella vulgaris]